MKRIFLLILTALLSIALCVPALAAEGEVFELTVERVENEEGDDGWIAATDDPNQIFEPGTLVTFRIHYNVPEKSILEKATGIIDGALALNLTFTNLSNVNCVYMWTKICSESTCMVYTDLDRLHMNGSASATIDLTTYQGGYVVFQGTVAERAKAGLSQTLTYGDHSETASFYINKSLDVIVGDVNKDGVVNTGDAAMILCYSAGTTTFTEEQMKLGDVNHDNMVNTGDAALILMWSVGV
ncbi:MAG: dockerin type I repeat-containing protein [Clostridia bacterium]